MSDLIQRAPGKWLGVLQPVYLPWLGYFDQMARVDHFVFQNDVQYTRHDWRNRNRIKTANGPAWLTVPVSNTGQSTLIHDVTIDYARNWGRKHVQTLRQSYAGAQRMPEVVEAFAAVVERQPAKLEDLTIPLVGWLAGEMGIRTPVSRASDVPGSPGAGLNERILEIALHHEATGLYLGAKAAEYVHPEFFAPHGIQLVFQDYVHPVYPQLHGEFASHMSAIDALMNVSQPSLPALLRGGHD